jgi:hypothetical protein
MVDFSNPFSQFIIRGLNVNIRIIVNGDMGYRILSFYV